jgi:antitoxin (DNA-binding transcriptional repressor) of toxin-antitoxin stability system
MAVIHISEAEAARDLHSLLAKARAGEEVRIESGADSFALVPATGRRNDEPRLISEILADMQLRSRGGAAPPAGFANFVQDGIRSHEHEFLADAIDSWE